MQQTQIERKVVVELGDIRTRLDALTMLYKSLLDALVKTGRIMPDEKRAVVSRAKLASEKELLEALKA